MPPSTLAPSAPARSAPSLPTAEPRQPAVDGTAPEEAAVFVDRTGRRRRLMSRLGLLVVLPAVAFVGVLGLSAVNELPVKQPTPPAEQTHQTASLVAGRQVTDADLVDEWSGVPTWEPPAPTGAQHVHRAQHADRAPGRTHHANLGRP